MGGPGRAGLELSQIHGIGQWLGQWLPNEVGLGPWFFQPTEQGVTTHVQGDYRIFPWMILSWTVEVFFFSAILNGCWGEGKISILQDPNPIKLLKQAYIGLPIMGLIWQISRASRGLKTSSTLIDSDGGKGRI